MAETTQTTEESSTAGTDDVLGVNDHPALVGDRSVAGQAQRALGRLGHQTGHDARSVGLDDLHIVRTLVG